MQRIQYLTFLAVALLVCASGCDSRQPWQSQSGNATFNVDDARYSMGWKLCINRQGEIALSFLTVFPEFSDASARFTEYNRYRDTFVTELYIGKEKVIAKNNTLYFIQDNKIILENSYQELGIDAQRLNSDLNTMLVYLIPILEKLIRENVQPQEKEE